MGATLPGMDAAEREALEQELRRQFDAGELHAVATATIRGYGPELYGMLVNLAKDADVAAELFAGACEKLWKALPAFRWESSMRVWAYAIVRHHFLRWTRERDRQRKQVPVSEFEELAAQVRTTTAIHLRTEVKDGFAKLRETLEPDDQLLLTLRLDGMAWNDVARVLAGEGAPPTAKDVAALRKRYERLKRELRELARERDLIP